MRSAAMLLCLSVPLLSADRRISIVWEKAGAQGEVQVSRGTLASGKPGFDCAAKAPCRIDLTVGDSGVTLGEAATLVTVSAAPNSFTFFLRDVSSEWPIFIPEYGVAVTTGDDRRSYAEIERAVRSRGLQSKLEQVESEPEESFDEAASNVRNLQVQTWLGLGRDIRIFAVGERLDWIQPRFHGYEVKLPEAEDKPVRYSLLTGRGWGPRDQIARRLEEGVLPILHAQLVDEDITYEITAFTTMETSPLREGSGRGTHFLVADGFGHGHMFTPEQQKLHDSLLPAETNQPEETVLYLRAVAVNTSGAPAYAFFKHVSPSNVPASEWKFDSVRGYGVYKSGRVFSVATLDGKPLPREEAALPLAPGRSAVLEIRLPHRPISAERAVKLAAQDFAARHVEARDFWHGKLRGAARVHLPEKRIEEMIQAGLLHLDLVTYGLEPEGTLTSTIGVYSAIGSESSPIIQFMDAMGRHDVARRALQYFLDKQHDDGFIQNFGGYMLETGAALWSIGEHYRYTRDDDWARKVAPKVVKACRYMQEWRKRNMREDFRGRGYGMLDGKTADPEDPFHSFMLNGYAYLGFARAAEMLERIDPAESRRWREEADGLRRDTRESFRAAMGRSPVVPLRNGRWCPTAPPWAEYRGPLALGADGGSWFTHGAMVSRDSLLGPIYLIFQEVLDPDETASSFLLRFHNELMTDRNVAFSQPYYSRHPVSHLRRGEVKPFLKAYYNTVAALADRQTYTFWEHYFGASPHKTHEEGWFLMDTRSMLYMERGDTLSLLLGAPRRWLEDGQRIELRNVASYFGPLSFEVVSDIAHGRIKAVIECDPARKPKTVEIRLPHPLGRKAVRAEGGTYDPATERVRIENFAGRTNVGLRF